MVRLDDAICTSSEAYCSLIFEINMEIPPSFDFFKKIRLMQKIKEIKA